MAIKIYRNENYIVIEQADGSKASGHCKDVMIRPVESVLNSSTRFNFSGIVGLTANSIVITSIQDGTGTVFSSAQDFIDWYSENTGNFNTALGGSEVIDALGYTPVNPDGNSGQYIAGDGSKVNFPSIPAAQINSDWNASSGVAQINNKPSIPTKTSDITNDSGYISSVPAQSYSSITGKPTTLSGYGITDAYPLNGNPSSFIATESDPTVPSYAKGLTAFSVIKTSTDALYEPVLSKNSAFNKNFGVLSNSVAEGNDSRIINGQTAFGWGNHAGNYPTYNGTGATGTWGISITGNSATATKLLTARTINGQSFDGSANITIPGSSVTAIPNTSLSNSSLTINGSSVSLGGSVTVTASPTISAPSVGNAITMGTAFQPRSGGACQVLINGSLTGALGLNESLTIAMSSTQNGTYTTVATDVLLIGVLGLTLDRSIGTIPVPAGYWIKVTRSGSASSATYTRWDF